MYTGHAQIGHWVGHVYISKQFPSLDTLSVTAPTQLVHICEQVSFQVGHSNLYSSVGIYCTVVNGAYDMKGSEPEWSNPQMLS